MLFRLISFRLVSFIFVISWSCMVFAKNEIKDISSVSELPMAKSTIQDLWVFDLDNTIFKTAQTLGSDQWFRGYWKNLKNKGLNESEIISNLVPLYNKIQHVTDVVLVEKEIAKIIRDLRKNNIKVIALTSRGYEVVSATNRHLNDVGISFDERNDSRYMHEVLGEHVLYNKGIIFANGRDKGKCLEFFLNKKNIKPKRIIFVDDHLKNVESISKITMEMEYDFEGYRYGYLDNEVADLDMSIATEQLSSIKIPSDNDVKKKQVKH
ncbi:MAG: DUF2608 domain-containing protein [Francisellaceae bacterium]|jgi:FMN phosphatase YigB (HAD superfamily)|nr:DUF2608 domain-containing protein [Francisellaceae bacterium]